MSDTCDELTKEQILVTLDEARNAIEEMSDEELQGIFGGFTPATPKYNGGSLKVGMDYLKKAFTSGTHTASLQTGANAWKSLFQK